MKGKEPNKDSANKPIDFLDYRKKADLEKAGQSLSFLLNRVKEVRARGMNNLRLILEQNTLKAKLNSSEVIDSRDKSAYEARLKEIENLFNSQDGEEDAKIELEIQGTEKNIFDKHGEDGLREAWKLSGINPNEIDDIVLDYKFREGIK